MRRIVHCFALVVVLAVVLSGVCGCSSKKLHPVDGQVTFPDGTPLKGGVVVFHPRDETIQEVARGEIHEDGSFVMSTNKKGDGVLEGTYQVIVLPPTGKLPPPSRGSPNSPARPQGGDFVPQELIHTRFFDVKTSGLEFTVRPGENHYPITVEK